MLEARTAVVQPPKPHLSVGQRLRRIAKGKGFKLKTLAPLVNTSPTHLNRVFTGTRSMSPPLLNRLIKALHLEYMQDVLHRDAAREDGWNV